MGYAIVKYIHFLGIFVLFSTLVVEHVLAKGEMSPIDIKRLSIVDLIYGISAGLVLVAGLCLWFLVGKPSGFYSSNPVFQIKLGLFILVALLSAYPTAFFIKNRSSTSTVVQIPKAVIMTIRLELLVILVLPLLAVLMAQGFGSA
jgi:putative membrane protein